MSGFSIQMAVTDVKAGSSRDLRVDAIRGLALVFMTWSHLPSNPLYRYIAQPFGIVYAAEVFVFASGLVTAWWMAGLVAKFGSAAGFRRSFIRAGQLYLTHLAMVAAFLCAVSRGILPHTLWAGQSGILHSMLQATWFGFQPTFLDILPMYVVFLLAAPLVFAQLKKQRAMGVALVSCAMWAMSEYIRPFNSYTFNIFAWQLLFVLGMVIGYRRQQSGIPTHFQAIAKVTCGVIAIVLFLVRHAVLLRLSGFVGHSFDYAIVNRHLLLPIRLINFGALAILVASIPRAIDSRLPAPIFRGLAFVGQSSLQVYVWSVVTAYAVQLRFLHWATLDSSLRLVMAVGCALSLLIPALLHKKIRKGSRRSTAQKIVPTQLPTRAIVFSDEKREQPVTTAGVYVERGRAYCGR